MALIFAQKAHYEVSANQELLAMVKKKNSIPLDSESFSNTFENITERCELIRFILFHHADQCLFGEVHGTIQRRRSDADNIDRLLFIIIDSSTVGGAGFRESTQSNYGDNLV